MPRMTPEELIAAEAEHTPEQHCTPGCLSRRYLDEIRALQQDVALDEQKIQQLLKQVESLLAAGVQMRKIDEKFHIENNQIIKTSNGDPVPEDEPLFLLRARDYLALPTLRDYCVKCVVDGCNDYQLTGIRDTLKKFEDFAAANPAKMKQPGITRGL